MITKKKKWLTGVLCFMAIYTVLRANSDKAITHNQNALSNTVSTVQEQIKPKEEKPLIQESIQIAEQVEERRKAIPLSEQCVISKGILTDGEELIRFLVSPFSDLKTADPKKFSDRKVTLFNPKLTEFKAKYSLPSPLFAEDEQLLFYASNGKLAIGSLANDLRWMLNARTAKEKNKWKEDAKVHRNFIKELENAIKEQCK